MWTRNSVNCFRSPMSAVLCVFVIVELGLGSNGSRKIAAEDTGSAVDLTRWLERATEGWTRYLAGLEEIVATGSATQMILTRNGISKKKEVVWKRRLKLKQQQSMFLEDATTIDHSADDADGDQQPRRKIQVANNDYSFELEAEAEDVQKHTPRVLFVGEASKGRNHWLSTSRNMGMLFALEAPASLLGEPLTSAIDSGRLMIHNPQHVTEPSGRELVLCEMEYSQEDHQKKIRIQGKIAFLEKFDWLVSWWEGQLVANNGGNNNATFHCRVACSYRAAENENNDEIDPSKLTEVVAAKSDQKTAIVTGLILDSVTLGPVAPEDFTLQAFGLPETLAKQSENLPTPAHRQFAALVLLAVAVVLCFIAFLIYRRNRRVG